VIYFLLAAYNEESDLPRLFEEFITAGFNFPYHIIVVDDGSTDNTAAIAEGYKNRLPVSVLRHNQNRGLGKALGTGLHEISGRIKAGDILVTIDADGTHPLDTVYEIKKKIESGADVVVASRFIRGGGENGVSVLRRSLSHTANFGLRILWPIKNIRDYSSGFRGYSNVILSRLNDVFGSGIIRENGFAATLELLLKADIAGAAFDEAALKLRYDAKKGRSKMKIIKTILDYFRLIVRLWPLKAGK